MLRTMGRILLFGVCFVALVAAFKEFGLYGHIMSFFYQGVDWFSDLFRKF